METEKAIERLKRGIEDIMFSTLYSQEQEEEDIKTVLKELEKKDKMIELIEKECRQRLAFAKRIRRSEKRNPEEFNQGIEFECAAFMNLLSGEPHWKYEGKYFDDIDKQVEKLKAEESE